MHHIPMNACIHDIVSAHPTGSAAAGHFRIPDSATPIVAAAATACHLRRVITCGGSRGSARLVGSSISSNGETIITVAAENEPGPNSSSRTNPPQ